MYLICGEALYDVFVDPASEEHDRRVILHAIAGGSPHNVAVGLARLSCPVALATELADDALGNRLERHLAREGVDCRFLRRTAASTPLAMVYLDERGIARYAFHGLDRMRFHPELETVAAAWDTLFGVHVGSIPIVSSQSASHLLELVSTAPAGHLISFDPNVRLSIEPDVGRWQRAVDQFRRQAHLIKVGEDDLVQLYGRNVDCAAIAQSWLTDRCSLVVVTRGEQGATLFSRTNPRIDIEPIRVIVADTVGAGDSYQAALLAWLAEHRHTSGAQLARLSQEEIKALGRFAARAATFTCRYSGPEFPNRQALD